MSYYEVENLNIDLNTIFLLDLNDYFFEGGSLLDIIKHKLKLEDCQNGVFDEYVIATILRETLKGLEYFHKNGQIHRYLIFTSF